MILKSRHGKDGRILDSVLDRADKKLIDNAVRRFKKSVLNTPTFY